MTKTTGDKGVKAMDGFTPSKGAPIQKGYQPSASVGQQAKPPTGGSAIARPTANNAQAAINANTAAPKK